MSRIKQLLRLLFVAIVMFAATMSSVSAGLAAMDLARDRYGFTRPVVYLKTASSADATLQQDVDGDGYNRVWGKAAVLGGLRKMPGNDAPPAAMYPDIKFLDNSVRNEALKPAARRSALIIPAATLKPASIPAAALKPASIPAAALKPASIPAATLKPASIPATALKPATRPAVDLKTEQGKKSFCMGQGGQVVDFQIWNGNAPGNQPVGIPIADIVKVCSFPNEEGSNYYYVPLDTLASTKPTLAVLAFQALVPYIPSKNVNVNPSSVYCAQLGGAMATNTPAEYLPIPAAAVGWWHKISGKWLGVSDFCTFPDGSSMDTWTLLYHAATNSSAGIPSASGIKFAWKKPVF